MGLTNAAIEPRIRQLVAERLGVSPEDLIPEASLADELAVDSLDLLEVAIAIEAELGIVVAERPLAGVRSYGDLGVWSPPLSETRRPSRPWLPGAGCRVVPAEGGPRSGSACPTLTPYAAETVEGCPGRGRGLPEALRGRVAAGTVARVRALPARLVEHGIPVHVTRAGRAPAGSRPAA
jgi:acyl carrier protein